MAKEYTIINCSCEGIIVKETEKLVSKTAKGHLGPLSSNNMNVTTYYCNACGLVYKASVIEAIIRDLTTPL